MLFFVKVIILIDVSLFLSMRTISESIGNCHSLVEVLLLVFYPLPHFFYCFFRKDNLDDISIGKLIRITEMIFFYDVCTMYS